MKFNEKVIMMKKIIPIILVVVIIVAGFVLVPKVTHTCSDCEEFFVGAGYEPNVVNDLLSEETQIICEECAEKQHAIAIAMGKSLEEFKLDIF